jgi:hypothetical protein
MGASMAVEGSTTKEVFEAYLEGFLTSALRPEQIVVMDHLGVHKLRDCPMPSNLAVVS